MRPSLGPLTLLSTLVLFLLPFVEFSCQGKKVVTLTGYDAAFGSEVRADLPISKWIEEREGRFRDRPSDREGSFDLTIKNTKRVDADWRIMTAFFCAVLGGFAAFFLRAAGLVGGVAACVWLLYAQNEMNKNMQEAPPFVVMSLAYGFWLALGAAALGAVLCVVGGRK
jgi:hypothetical protein